MSPKVNPLVDNVLQSRTSFVEMMSYKGYVGKHRAVPSRRRDLAASEEYPPRHLAPSIWPEREGESE